MLLGGLTAGSLSGCGFFSTDPDTEQGGSNGGSGTGGNGSGGYRQAPMLDDWDTELPPVAERLPVDPLVVEPTERIGTYGGTWRTAITGAADGPWLHRTVGYETLMRWDRDWTQAIPNVAGSFEANADATEFEIKLREGHRWSDGEPFTTADVEFGFEHVLMNETLPGPAEDIVFLGGEPAELEVVDETTFFVRFASPNPLFVEDHARGVTGDRLCTFPRHYLEQFHGDFSDEAEQLAEAAGYSTWQEYFNFLANDWGVYWSNLELPSLKAWVVVDAIDTGGLALFRRNPYYFKVDPDGNQLPYLDQVSYDIVPEAETMLLHAQNGDYDFHSRHFNTLDNRPVLADAADRGDYHLIDLRTSLSTDMAIALNLNHQDDVLREIFQTKDFRVALSHAINRQRLINTVWQRAGMPHQVAPTSDSKYYDEEFATQYLEYDPELAEQILDSAGFDEKDGDGFRLRPDGGRIQITVDVPNDALIALWPEAMDLVAEDWSAVGIRTVVNAMPREQWQTRMQDENSQDANVWTGDGGFGDERMAPNWYVPAGFGANWATQWTNWYTSRGEEGEEPPEPVLEQQRLLDEFNVEPDADERDRIFRRLLEIAKEQFWAIGTVRVPDTYAVVSNRLHNVGGTMPEAASYNTPAPANPEQWFLEDA